MTSSSTSDADASGASGLRAFLAAARLVHPFPSILDGLVVALVAAVSGGSVPASLVLGLSMTLLQFAIGTVNDIVDAPRDAGHRGGKPIPDGFVTIRAALIVAVASAGGGLVLAFVGGPWLAGLGVVVLGVGLAYDLWAKGTTLSWLPFAVGIPLLPVFGWYGATGMLPGLFLVLVPAAANAGTALAIANAIVDMERDEEAGSHSIALALGPARAGWLVVVLHAVVAALAFGTAVVMSAPMGWVAAILLAATAPLAGAVIGLVAAQRPATTWRELAWEIQAVGTGLLAVAWLGALSAGSGTPLGA
ncbi:MAG TPA: UbiA family prenyltransferase [Candidatus Limnocylindrales bacterium]